MVAPTRPGSSWCHTDAGRYRRTMATTIRTDQLTKRYGRTVALDGLDLEVQPGEVFGYLGPNGAGKSTTIGLLLGLLRPTSGRAFIFDIDAWRDAPALHRRLAYVSSEANPL